MFIAPKAPLAAAPKPTSAPPAPPQKAPTAPSTGDTAPGSTSGRSGRQPVAELREAVETALQVDPAARMTVDKTSNGVTFLSGQFKVDVQPGVGGAPLGERVAQGFLKAHGKLFGVNTVDSLRLIGSEKDDLGFSHMKYQQYFGDLPVFGQQLIVHTKEDTVQSVGGRVTPNIVIDTTPALDVRSLTAQVTARKGVAPGANPVAPPTLGVYTTPGGTPYLAYELDMQGPTADARWRMYIDADTGKVLDKWDLIHSAMNRETHDARNGQSKPGQLARKEGDGPVADEVINKAHDNAGAVYNYYKTLFNRDSLDNRGMKLTSTVHYGNRYNNAFWDGRQMTYGDGDGNRFIYFGNAADVVGHEMAHGVTERTAGLRYFKQSGALNESWSDVFGNLIEKWADQQAGKPERDPKWLVGEEIFTPGTEGDGLRSMSAPGTGYAGDPQPGHMKDYKDTSSDNGGVHINSGIPNKAAYEVAMNLGAEKLGRIWYRAVTNYLTPSSQFLDAANVTVQSAADLYGKDSAEVKAVQTAWTNVGLKPTVVPGIG